jgi:DNA-binding transcriptional regulator YiaG
MINYTQLYIDMIASSFPEKMETKAVKKFLEGKKTAMKVIEINQFISDSHQLENQKHQCYDKETILEIINYQADNELTNHQTATLYNISLVTLRKWKKHFQSSPPPNPLPKGGGASYTNVQIVKVATGF